MSNFSLVYLLPWASVITNFAPILSVKVASVPALALPIIVAISVNLVTMVLGSDKYTWSAPEATSLNIVPL